METANIINLIVIVMTDEQKEEEKEDAELVELTGQYIYRQPVCT